jgi:hypothetical protein
MCYGVLLLFDIVKGMRGMAYKWKPLQEAHVDPRDYLDPRYRAFAELQAENDGSTVEEAAAKLARDDERCHYWRNDLYQVCLRYFTNEAFGCEMAHINIRRIDGAPVFDWRHRQLIKNQLVGEECEAFEIYPAESRLSDEANKYHLWAFLNPRYRIPVEVADGRRHVQREEVRFPAGMRQRGY